MLPSGCAAQDAAPMSALLFRTIRVVLALPLPQRVKAKVLDWYDEQNSRI